MSLSVSWERKRCNSAGVGAVCSLIIASRSRPSAELIVVKDEAMKVEVGRHAQKEKEYVKTHYAIASKVLTCDCYALATAMRRTLKVRAIMTLNNTRYSAL